jgi:hypothetical protein
LLGFEQGAEVRGEVHLGELLVFDADVLEEGEQGAELLLDAVEESVRKTGHHGGQVLALSADAFQGNDHELKPSVNADEQELRAASNNCGNLPLCYTESRFEVRPIGLRSLLIPRTFQRWAPAQRERERKKLQIL